MTFPRDFLFGTATASYQIEGGVADGGRTPSIWDTFSHTPGAVSTGETGDVACDFYHRYREDIELMSGLGVNASRMSLSWSRLLPDGRGEPNPEGVAFYRSVLTELRERGIAPLVTLYHWDLPQALQDEGGWTTRRIVDDFEHYARVAARTLGDLVDTWITLNEPWCTAFLGHASGVHAPGHTDAAEALAAAHHLNVAHGRAVVALREELGEETRVGVALNIHVIRPEQMDDDAHLDAVRRIEQVGNHIFLGPMLEGAYPTELIAEKRGITDWSFIHEGDLQTSLQRLDVLGVNYYATSVVRPAGEDASGGTGGHGVGAATPWVGCEDIEFVDPEGPLTDMGWNIDPDGLYDLLTSIDRVYPGTAVMVMENGAAFPDVVENGAVHDEARIDYLRRHLAVLEEAIDDGVDVRGYMLWSFLDNFEWAWGYSRRFGLVHVDFETLERTPKDSYGWYRDFVAEARAAAEREAEEAAEREAASEATEAPEKRRGGLFGWLRRS